MVSNTNWKKKEEKKSESTLHRVILHIRISICSTRFTFISNTTQMMQYYLVELMTSTHINYTKYDLSRPLMTSCDLS